MSEKRSVVNTNVSVAIKWLNEITEGGGYIKDYISLLTSLFLHADVSYKPFWC